MRACFLMLGLSALFATVVVGQQPLAKWRGRSDVFEVKGRDVVGSTVGIELDANTFFISDREYGDFEMSTLVSLDGDNNGGVQYRSRVVDEKHFRVQGYQCDVHPKPEYVAMLYHEGGVGIAAEHGQFVRWTDDGREVLGRIAKPRTRDLKAPHWLRIVAQGNLMWHEIDGQIVTAVQDLRTNAPKRGVIALQVHRGKPMTASYRGVTVRELGDRRVDVPPSLQALLKRAELTKTKTSGQTPNWVWDESAQDGEEVFLRRSFKLDVVPESARLAVSCDNHCRVYVNGERVLEDDSWESVSVQDVHEELVPGENVVAVHAWNDGGPAAMALRLSWGEGDGERELVTDASWRCSDDDPDGWDAAGFDDAKWATATLHGAMGGKGVVWSGTHGRAALGENGDAFAPQVAVLAPDIEDLAAHGHSRVVQMLDVPRSLGSWVSLCADAKGRLYAGNQGDGLYRVQPAGTLGELTTIERVPVELGGAHGLLWWRDALYAVVNGGDSGLYRLTDTDGDDVLDRVELLRKLEGRGEHGPHSVVVAPDGEHLLVVCGNHTKLPDLVASRIPHEVAEDRLLSRLDDPHKYWEGHSPRGGWVCQCDADGKNWELITCGFRNPYDIVVLPTGAVAVFDADMEWDMGMPWYRPTRILRVESGVDYGWRIGSGKWPTDYPDAPPSVVDIGPGSPTGMCYLPGMHGGVVALDWTFGTIYVAGQPRWVGAPWPVADITVAPDQRGSGVRVFVVSGGRGLPSRLLELTSLSGDDCDWTDQEGHRNRRSGPPLAWQEQETRTWLELLELAKTEPVSARIALERLPVQQWRQRVVGDRSLPGMLALARQGSEEDRAFLLQGLGALDFRQLDHAARIAWLRVHAVTLLRMESVSDKQRQLVADRLMPLLPTGNERQDQDLIELLAHVDAKGLLDKAIPMLSPMKPSTPPQWAEVITRNARYGGVIDKMIANMPPMGQIAIANALRTVENGWTLAQRRAFFEFLGEARKQKGGSSYDGFLQRIIDAAWKTCSPAEQQVLAEVVGKAKAELPKFRSTPAKGPGRNWQLRDADELLRGGLQGRDVASGRNLFHAVGCATCHLFKGEGGSGGPDLTSLGNKFSARDVFEAIVEPSKVISDQYVGQILTRKNGTTHFGVVRRTYDGDTEVYEVIPATAHSEPLRIPVDEVESVKASPMSPMPQALANPMNADELKDLLAFLVSR